MKTLAEYLAEYLATEIERRQEEVKMSEGALAWDTGDLKNWLKEGIEAYESTEGVKVSVAPADKEDTMDTKDTGDYAGVDWGKGITDAPADEDKAETKYLSRKVEGKTFYLDYMAKYLMDKMDSDEHRWKVVNGADMIAWLRDGTLDYQEQEGCVVGILDNAPADGGEVNKEEAERMDAITVDMMDMWVGNQGYADKREEFMLKTLVEIANGEYTGHELKIDVAEYEGRRPK